MASRTATTPATMGHRPVPAGARAEAVPVLDVLSTSASSISKCASATEWSLNFGSFSRHRVSSRRRLDGVDGGSAFQSGSRSRIFAIVSEVVAPGNARRPVSISYKTQPNAQISVRASTACPRACSGLMYAAVPKTAPCEVPVIVGADPAAVGSEPRALAMPKSSTFTAPSGVTLILEGFRSRWTMPWSCADAIASEICRAIRRVSATGIGPLAIRSASCSPSTSSITRPRADPDPEAGEVSSSP